MPSVQNDFALQAVSLLVTDSKSSGPSQGLDAFIATLAKEARAPDAQRARDAMEVLVNLALDTGCGADDPGPHGAVPQAKAALMAIAGDSGASPQARAAIRELAFQAFEITAGRGFPAGKDGKGATRQPTFFRLSPALLALALRHAEAAGYDARRSEVGQVLADTLKLESSARSEMLHPNRYCTFAEIRNGVGTDGGHGLSLHPYPLMTGVESFGSSLADPGGRISTAASPHVFIVHHKNHWVAVVAGPSEQSGKLDVVVYDSLHEAGHAEAAAITTKIRSALGEQLHALTYAGGNVQGNTNGCGPLCARAVSVLQSAAASDRDMRKVADTLLKDIAHLRHLDAQARSDVIAGWRARMLEGLERSESLGEDFRTQMNAPVHASRVEVPGTSLERALDGEDSGSVRFHAWPEG